MLFEGIRKLQEYGVELPKEYNDFILKHGMDDFYGRTFKIDNSEYEICNFLKEGETAVDLFKWYVLTEGEHDDYLTIAFCMYNEEIAIKIKGEDKGKVVLLTKDDYDEDDDFKVTDIASDFNEFINKIL